MVVLVTGSKGFIGSHLCRDLRQGGTELIEAGRETDLARLDWKSVDWVIHCASRQPRSHAAPESYWKGNVESLRSVLARMREVGVRKIIHFSSAAVYGDQGEGILDETTAVSPAGDYAVSKWESEKLLRKAAGKDGLTAFCLRMPSVFGLGHEGGLVNTYYDLARKNEVIEIYAEGKLLRSLVDVEDVVRACRAIRSGSFSPSFHLLVLGSADVLPMKEIAALIVKKLGSRSNLRPVKKVPPVNVHWNLSTARLQKVLKFRPATIEKGLDRYLAERKDD